MNDATNDWLKSKDCSEYFELLRFPTIGADPLHLRDCIQCATWLKKWLQAIGAEAELVLPQITGAQSATGEAGAAPVVPVVFGELKRSEDAMTVLVYGHYDVQPPDPVEQWKTPPFEPTVKGEGDAASRRIYARGAQDDKGQLFAFLCGLRKYLSPLSASTSSLPLNIKFIFEGQEESGSATLFKLLEDPSFRRRVAADVLLVCDTSAAADLRPAIVAGLRGVNHFTVTLTAANRDLHSGEYGGIAPNAAQGMAELMASLHNPDGSIAVAGFRDGILPPSHEELQAATAGLLDENGYADDIGCEPCGGQLGHTIAQRNAFEPTIEVNGIHSGYGGPGSKTVIPCSAMAKISTRLVPGQNPRASFEAVKNHLLARCPRGMHVEFSELSGIAPGFRLPLASPLFRLAEDVLNEMDARGAVFQWDGASIPVVSALKEASCAAPLLVGWGQPQDCIHSPNESFSLRQFQLAADWAARIIAALAALA